MQGQAHAIAARYLALLSAVWLALAGAASAAPGQPSLRIFAAGSLRAATTELLARSGLQPDEIAPPVFGPAGTLGDRIAGGAGADILASADMAQPRRFSQGGHPVVLFARNRICAFARRYLQLTSANFLDRLLDSKVRVAMSTPGVDPSGDYAQELFGRANKVHPGAEAALTAKAIRLGGGATRPAAGSAASALFLENKADVLISYCSAAESLSRELPGIVPTPAPADLAPQVDFGLVVLSNNPMADRLVGFIMSQQGQAILARHGFVPVAATMP